MRLTGPVDRRIQKSSSVRYRRLRVRNSDSSVDSCCSCDHNPQIPSCDSQPRCHRTRNLAHISDNWLELLPLEVCTIIAHFVRRNELNDYDGQSALNLAEVSEKQGNAVVEAFSHELRFPIEEGQRWARVFRNGIRKLSTGCFLNESVCHLLRSPTLRSAVIPNISAYLESISRAPALKTLSVDFADRSPLEPFTQSVHILLAALKALNLQELRFKCVGMCIFKDVFRTREAWLELAGLCPNLEILDLVCICSSDQVELTQFINALTRLRKFTFNRPVSKRTLESLWRIESVSLRHVWDGGLSMQDQCELAVKIGEPVKSLESTFFPLCARPSLITRKAMASLSNCKHLSELDMHVTAGAEHCFPALSELRSLRLRWENSSANSLQGTDEHFHSPSPGFFMFVVKMAPNLRTLCIFNVRISLRDITNILSEMGSRLLVFGTSIIWQSEPAEERLVAVLDILGRNNHYLQNLDIFGYPQIPRNQCAERFCAYWRRKIICSLKVVERRSPLFDNRELIRFIDKWLVF